MRVHNINEKYIKQRQQEMKKFKIRAIAVSLSVAFISSSVLAGCKLNSADEKMNNVMARYVEDNEFDISMQPILEKLEHYQKVYNEYFEDKDNLDKKVELIKETKKLEHVADLVVTKKVNDALDTNYEYVQLSHNPDGDLIFLADGELLKQKPSIAFNELANNVDSTRQYKGDGTSDKWTNSVTVDFVKEGANLSKCIAKIAGETFIVDGNRVKPGKQQETEKNR